MGALAVAGEERGAAGACVVEEVSEGAEGDGEPGQGVRVGRFRGVQVGAVFQLRSADEDAGALVDGVQRAVGDVAVDGAQAGAGQVRDLDVALGLAQLPRQPLCLPFHLSRYGGVTSCSFR